MFFYKLGYWTFDGAAAIELMHEKWWGRQEFEQVVYRAIADQVRAEGGRSPHLPFAWIYEAVADQLIAEHGFRKLEYAAEFEVYGSGSVLDGDQDLPDLEKLTQFLRDEGLAEPR